ncbi:sigma-54-dependent transcriptional regulator [Candidatus Finniella inopinata]|uniref:Sigma-54-dependent Fis family transcriptional regulator n=1 Tax=Candidatus Finniella inopinata TaxID=1696036 RepID=A0A4Q7DFY4_9PROT|nr:sigma-54 dependent transcriptional regulator [Candidatus Finniella inopinata]RZI45210.1 sigma-54-dependent Fis family transcriptional regulator [Candidatus Finniella inopinata]
MSQDILIVDDESDIRELIAGILSDEGHTTRMAADGLKALELIKMRQPNLVVLDVWLGDSERDGLKILDIIKRDHPFVPVIMISGHGTIETAVSAMRKGAYDFLEKPFQTEHLLLVVERALESARLKQENQELKIKARTTSGIVGNSSAIYNIRQTIAKNAPTNGRCFISGPLGADKESIAREIHTLSKRAQAPFVVVKCASLHPQNLDVELFGADITGLSADTPRKIGLLEKAHGGTLYFDEITQLPLPIQAKVVKAIQENAFYRVGGEKPIDINIRFLASSSENVMALIQNGHFREDLYYRLGVSHLIIPSLQERVTDIPLLVESFMEQAAAAKGVLPRRFSQEALVMLQSYSWPGDLQQLSHVIDWVLLMATGEARDPIETHQLPTEIVQGNRFVNNWQQKTADIVVLPLREAREAFEKDYLLAQLQRFAGNISQTARFVGMERSALHRKLRALGVHDPKGSEKDADEHQEISA